VEPWYELALKIIGAIALLTPLLMWIFNRGSKKAGVDISKTEREADKLSIEKYLVELNVSEIIDKKAEVIENKYKDIIFSMQKEHFEIKKDMQGRLEKEMKIRIEAEQENEILKNELHLLRETSNDQSRKIAELTKKVNQLEKNGK
jgi:hypothetical protein